MTFYYFTSSYPYGIQEQWKRNEILELKKYFNKIVIIPFSYNGNNQIDKNIPENVSVLKPLFSDDEVYIPLNTRIAARQILSSKFRFKFLAEFFRKKVYKNKNHYHKWYKGSLQVLRLARHRTLVDIFNAATSEDIFYFYWGLGSCELLPFLSNKKIIRSFIRMHRYDLFEEVNDFYIPYRRQLLQAATIVAPCSQTGRESLLKFHPNFDDKIKVFRVGSVSTDKVSDPSSDVLTIISCSLLKEVKRVHIMIEACKLLSMPFKWIHLGDGPLRNELEILTKKLNLEEKFIFEGHVNSNIILDYYTTNKYDLFINVSESEGVPISIMEALSVGIPVLATDAGGTKEIVDSSVGAIMPIDITPVILADHITRFYELTDEQKMQKRISAKARHEEMCNLKVLANELGQYLVNDF